MMPNLLNSSFARMINGLSVPALGLGMALSVTSGCMLDRRPLGPGADGGMGGEGGMTVTDGGGGMGGDGGTGGEGGMGGLIAGSQYIPAPAEPGSGLVLAPLRSFYAWQNGEVPSGRTLQAFEFCRTEGAAPAIDDAALCPNITTSLDRFRFLDPLPPSTTQRWKVRALYDGGYFSDWSAVSVYSSDASIVGRWLFEGNGNDASGSSHTGTLHGGAVFASGLFGQALSINGTDGYMDVASAADLNFGTGDFTLAAWVRPARNGVAEALITKRTSTGAGFELFRTDTGALAFYGSGCGIAVTGGSLPMNAWHRIVASRSAGVVTLWIDDASAGAGACADNFTNAAVLAFGCLGPDLSCGEPFQGLIDELSVRNAATGGSVIRNQYCADQAVLGGTLPAACLP